MEHTTNGQVILSRFRTEKTNFYWEMLAKNVPESQYPAAKKALLENNQVKVQELTKEEYPNIHKILNS